MRIFTTEKSGDIPLFATFLVTLALFLYAPVFAIVIEAYGYGKNIDRILTPLFCGAIGCHALFALQAWVRKSSEARKEFALAITTALYVCALGIILTEPYGTKQHINNLWLVALPVLVGMRIWASHRIRSNETKPVQC